MPKDLLGSVAASAAPVTRHLATRVDLTLMTALWPRQAESYAIKGGYCPSFRLTEISLTNR